MILSLVFLVAALLVFFDLIEPAYGNVQSLKGKQLSLQNFVDQESKIIDQAKKVLADYENASQAQDNLALAMPAGPNVAMAVAQIYGIAQNNGVVVSGISVSPPVVQITQGSTQPAGSSAGTGANSGALGAQIVKPRGSVSIQISATGSYESLKAFLAQLETNIRIFDLTGISIQPVAGGSAPATAGGKAALANPDLFNYTVAVTTYYQLP